VDGYSAKSFLSKVDLPDPEGPEMMSGDFCIAGMIGKISDQRLHCNRGVR